MPLANFRNTARLLRSRPPISGHNIMKELSQKTVLVTGCSSGGIGAALAETFHKQGYHVFATARTPSKIPSSLASAPNVTVLTLDVQSSHSIAAAAEIVSEKTGGKLDVLVNNAGRSMILPALDTTIEQGKEIFDLNFWGAFAMIQAFSPVVIKSKGCIVNNASISGPVPLPFSAMYNASKAAIISAAETLRYELAPFGVRTLTLITCAVATGASNRARTTIPEESYYSGIQDIIYSFSDGRMNSSGMSVEKYASQVVRAVERGASGKFWAGKDASMNRWLMWLMPQWILDNVVKSLFPFSDQLAADLKKKGFGV